MKRAPGVGAAARVARASYSRLVRASATTREPSRASRHAPNASAHVATSSAPRRAASAASRSAASNRRARRARDPREEGSTREPSDGALAQRLGGGGAAGFESRADADADASDASSRALASAPSASRTSDAKATAARQPPCTRDLARRPFAPSSPRRVAGFAPPSREKAPRANRPNALANRPPRVRGDGAARAVLLVAAIARAVRDAPPPRRVGGPNAPLPAPLAKNRR